jgi:murein DD-endopeptidase MepM/ murein hydrolase activator NlpD
MYRKARRRPVGGVCGFHGGIDIAVPNGTPVKARGNGTVTQVVNNTYYGNVVVIQMDNGLTTADMHLQSSNVKVGDTVKTGQEIGKAGTIGEYTTGGHDHFTVWDAKSKVTTFTKDNTMVTRDTINPRDVLPS